MQLLASKRISSHLTSKLGYQAGISLIPAVITVFIFSMLTTQVIIPNQFREQREVRAKAITNTAEHIVQAALAYNADPDNADPDNENPWPSHIDDLVPDYLPFLNNKENWDIESNITGSKGMKIVVKTASDTEQNAVIQKIGDIAQKETNNRVAIAVASPEITTLTISDLVVNGNVRVKGGLSVDKYLMTKAQLTANSAAIRNSLTAKEVEIRETIIVGKDGGLGRVTAKSFVDWNKNSACIVN